MTKLLGFLFIFLLPINLCFSAEVIKIGTFPYPPYHTEKGGFLNDFYQAIFDSVGREVEFVFNPLRRSESHFLKGKVDIFSSHVLIAKENIELIDRMNILKFNASFFFLKSEGDFKNLSMLNKQTVGVIQNTPYAKLYTNNGLELNYLKDPFTLLKMTTLKRVKAFESTFLTGVNYIMQEKQLDQFGYFIFDVIDSGPGILKSHQNKNELNQLLEQGFKNITKNGQLIKILEKYWGKNNIPRSVLPNDLKDLGKDQPGIFGVPLNI